MTVDLVVLIALAVGLVCGWLARWQWDRKNWEPITEEDFKRWTGGVPPEEDEFDRWDRS